MFIEFIILFVTRKSVAKIFSKDRTVDMITDEVIWIVLIVIA